MSISINRRGTAVLVAACALLVGSLSVAAQANASTLYACVKKNGTARVFTKKPKCKKGESKLSWNNVGPAGRNGANGVNGAPGSAGKNGTNGSNGANGTNGTNGLNGTARGYAVVSPSVVFEGAHPGFSEVTRVATGKYCLAPTAASGLDQSGATIGDPGSAAAVSVDWGWSSGGEQGSVELRQRPFGNCPPADFEVYTFKLNAGTFEASNSIGFHVIVP
jgi:hypothetical protein